MAPSFKNYAEFWPFYLAQHSKTKTKWLHVVGLTIALSVAVSAFLTGNYWWLLLCPVVGYGFAWFGHFVFEGNRPATFGHPVWSFISDFRMAFLLLTGRL